MYEIYCRLCEEKGVTSYIVARATGIADSTLSDWKRKGAPPKADKLLLIARYFGVTVDYLLTGETTNLEMNLYSDEEKNLISLFRNTSDDTKRIIFAALEAGQIKKGAEILRDAI